MKINIKGIKIFKSNIHKDHRGFFKEVYKKKILKNKQLIFHCASSSKKQVLRGLHLQIKNPQAKFLTVLKGKIVSDNLSLSNAEIVNIRTKKVVVSDEFV